VEGKIIKDDRKPYSLVPEHTRVCKALRTVEVKMIKDDRKPYSLVLYIPVYVRQALRTVEGR